MRGLKKRAKLEQKLHDVQARQPTMSNEQSSALWQLKFEYGPSSALNGFLIWICQNSEDERGEICFPYMCDAECSSVRALGGAERTEPYFLEMHRYLQLQASLLSDAGA